MPAGQWRAGGSVQPGPGGFVHLSTPEQVHLPANRLYPGRRDMLLLCVDPARLSSELRWEHGVPADPSAMRFPHLYGPLPATAVIAVLDYLPSIDGTFAAPAVD
ncbi:MAG: DUF952 domain-containing protein [Actinomycetota bacterium]|nr:DUF952 domain-containing protein [Actinomycetota bacterium]